MFTRRTNTFRGQPSGVRRPAPWRRRGTAIVETALVLPIALMFLFGLLEYGRYMFTLQVLTVAGMEGCRYAVTHTSAVVLGGTTYANTTSAVTTIVSNMSGGVTLSGQATNVFCSDALGNNLGSWTSATAGQCVCVQVTGNYVPVVAKLLKMSTSIPVQTQAVMRVEGT